MIRVGIGGWVFEPWRGTFYPKGLAKTRELSHASRRVSVIEINSTFYRNQTPATFRKWAAETPDDFVFSVKAVRFITHRRNLAEAGPSIDGFFDSGVLELGAKLGPILWQFPPTRQFDAEALSGFLDLLPKDQRHVVEATHPSFSSAEAKAFFRNRPEALAHVESEKHVLEGEPLGGLVYIRLKSAQEDEPTGYPPAALDAWAVSLRKWSKKRDCYLFFINGAKVRAPAAATALLERLREE